MINISFVSIQKFLVDYCGCYDEVLNPNYKNMKLSEMLNSFLGGKISTLLELTPMYLKFNPNKII